MNKDYYKNYKSLRKKLGIDEWLDLCKEDKILNGGYVSFGQYMYILEQQLEEKEEQLIIMSEAFDELKHQKQDYTQINILEMKLEEKNKIINEAIGLINHMIKELDKRDMLHPAETELLEILERR